MEHYDYPRLGTWRNRWGRVHYVDAGDKRRIGVREYREYVPCWLERLAGIEFSARRLDAIRDEIRYEREVESLRTMICEIERIGADPHAHYKHRRESALAEAR